jgi:phosphomannomutase
MPALRAIGDDDMSGIFKAYDIRGVYGKELTEEIAERIGRAYVTFVKCGSVVVGRDMRPHSQPLFEALCRGITRQGADVVDLGLCSTPMSYHACATLKTGGGIMITASHNPGEYNGFKLSRAMAVPISGSTGIQDIERIVNTSAFDAPPAKAGHVTKHDPLPAYRALVQGLAALRRPVRIVADYANAMGSVEAQALSGLIEIKPLFEKLDGTFPSHEANPLHAATLETLQREVRSGKYDFGVAFDGDADRVGFVDETGAIISMDIMTALIGSELLSREKGVVLYDLRSSWAVREVIAENGGTPMMSRVGHAFIKQQMRDNNAVFAGELSGHYYFRRNFFTESSGIATLCVANLVSRGNKPLSEFVRPLCRYHASGEINSTVAAPDRVMKQLREKYADGKQSSLDGVSVEYADWWFNVRASNTEPVVRLNVEAKTADQMARKRDELLALIRAK